MKTPLECVVDFLRATIPSDVVIPQNIIPAFTQTDREYPAISVALYGAHTTDAFYGMIKKIESVGGMTRIYYAYDKRVTLRITAWSEVSRQQADYIASFVEDALHRDWNDDHTINYWELREQNHIYNAVEILYDNIEPDDEIRQWNTVVDFFLVMENEWIDIVPTILDMEIELLGVLIEPAPCTLVDYTYAPLVTTHDVLIPIAPATCSAHSEVVDTILPGD